MFPIDILKMRNPAVPSGVTSVGTLFTGTGASGAVSMPTYASGDVVFVQVFHSNANGTAATTTAPTGWTLVQNFNSFSNVISHMIYRRVMDGSEGSSVTFTWNGGTTNRATQARAFTVKGANTAGSVTEGATTGSGSLSSGGTANMTSPAITTTGSNRLLLNFVGTIRGVSNTLAESTDSWIDQYLNASFDALGLQSSLSTMTGGASGIQGTETRHKDYSSGGSMNWNYVSFAVLMV